MQQPTSTETRSTVKDIRLAKRDGTVWLLNVSEKRDIRKGFPDFFKSDPKVEVSRIDLTPYFFETDPFNIEFVWPKYGAGCFVQDGTKRLGIMHLVRTPDDTLVTSVLVQWLLTLDEVKADQRKHVPDTKWENFEAWMDKKFHKGLDLFLSNDVHAVNATDLLGPAFEKGPVYQVINYHYDVRQHKICELEANATKTLRELVIPVHYVKVSATERFAGPTDPLEGDEFDARFGQYGQPQGFLQEDLFPLNVAPQMVQIPREDYEALTAECEKATKLKEAVSETRARIAAREEQMKVLERLKAQEEELDEEMLEEEEDGSHGGDHL